MANRKQEVKLELVKERRLLVRGKRSQFGKKRRRYFAVFLQQENNTLTYLKKTRLSPEIKTVQYKKGNAHIIDYNSPLFSYGTDIFYFIDIDRGQLTVSGQTNYNPALIDAIMKQNIIGQLTTSFSKKTLGLFEKLIYLGFGIALGFIIRGFF